MMVYLVPEWAQIRHSDKWQLKVLPLLNSAGISHIAVSCVGGVTHRNVCTGWVFPIEHNTFEALAAPLAVIHGIILPSRLFLRQGTHPAAAFIPWL